MMADDGGEGSSSSTNSNSMVNVSCVNGKNMVTCNRIKEDDEEEKDESEERIAGVMGRRTVLGGWCTSAEWTVIFGGEDGTEAGISKKLGMYRVFARQSTVHCLKAINSMRADECCSLCGVNLDGIVSGNIKSAKTLLRRMRVHMQQHFVLRLCGCQRLFLCDDSIRHHCKVEGERSGSCPHRRQGSAHGKSFNHPICIVDRESYDHAAKTIQELTTFSRPRGYGFPNQKSLREPLKLVPSRSHKHSKIVNTQPYLSSPASPWCVTGASSSSAFESEVMANVSHIPGKRMEKKKMLKKRRGKLSAVRRKTRSTVSQRLLPKSSHSPSPLSLPATSPTIITDAVASPTGSVFTTSTAPTTTVPTTFAPTTTASTTTAPTTSIYTIDTSSCSISITPILSEIKVRGELGESLTSNQQHPRTASSSNQTEIVCMRREDRYIDDERSRLERACLDNHVQLLEARQKLLEFDFKEVGEKMYPRL